MADFKKSGILVMGDDFKIGALIALYRLCTASKGLNYYMALMLHEDQPDVVLLHIGSNNINN